MIVLCDPAPITVHRNVTPRTAPRGGATPLADCRTCVFNVARACTCGTECDGGNQHTPTAPLRLWRGA